MTQIKADIFLTENREIKVPKGWFSVGFKDYSVKELNFLLKKNTRLENYEACEEINNLIIQKEKS